MRKSPCTSERWKRVEEVFHDALEKPRAKRQDYVTQACDGDGELRVEVERLLKGHDPSDQFIEPPDAALAALGGLSGDHGLLTNARIGSFEITRVIASGGMGTVYEALQDNPRRTVALKVLRSSRTSPAALRRFQHEWQVLGRLRHPMIAQVYEAGAYREGATNVPYFAMEYIPDAKSVVAFARDAKLTIRQKLKLCADICDAVQHGHQHGIIHRDLKPANIVVDGGGQPKVIDFGVARATSREMAVTTMQTDVGQLIGTLVYMSPEQCAANPEEIDTRSDVYSLGVVLYELLCDRLPYDVRERGIPDAARIIQHLPPKRPSTIDPALGGDIESMLLKVLEKEPERRYQSASDFATDLRRHLNNQPVEARPASMSYHLRLFARRNRAAVFAAACVMIVLVAAVVVSTTFAFKATRAANGETLARDRAERITTFLQNMISSASPYRTGRNVTVIEMLEHAAKDIETELQGQPEAEAGVRLTIGQTYASLWLWDDAIPHFQRALVLYRDLYESPNTKIADCLSYLGRALTFRDQSEAILMHREALDMRRRLHGPEHRLVAESMGNLAYALWASTAVPQWHEAERLYYMALKLYERLGVTQDDDVRNVARFKYTMATMFGAQNRMHEAQELFGETLEMFRELKRETNVEDAYMVRVMYDYAYALQQSGRIDEAAVLLTESLDLTPDGLAETQVFDAEWRLGAIRHNLLDFPGAEVHYRKSLAVRCRWLMGEFPEQKGRLQALFNRLSNANEPAPPYVEAFAAIREMTPVGDGEILRSMHDLGDVLQHTNPSAGEVVLGDCVRISNNYLHRNGWFIADLESLRGGCLNSLGRFKEAEPLVVDSYPYLARAGSLRNQRMLEALQRIVDLYEAWGKPERASVYRGLMFPPDQPSAALARQNTLSTD